MEEQYENREGVLIISLGREVDDSSAMRIRANTDVWIQSGLVNGILFDFTNTNFMDSAGVGLLMGRYKKLKTRGGFVGVTGVGKSIHRILEISGLYRLVEAYEIQN